MFDLLDTLVQEGKLAAWGVSVETCGEALQALEREHLASIQIILNPFRLKPLDEVVPLAEASLRWIVGRPGVTAAIPGARSAEQARRNAAAGSKATDDQRAVMERFDAAVHATYDELLRESIHPQW